jgi:hypothetical protein
VVAHIGNLIESPYTAMVFAVVCLGVALVGKLSVTASRFLFVLAWLIAIVGLRSQPLPIIVGGTVWASELLRDDALTAELAGVLEENVAVSFEKLV